MPEAVIIIIHCMGAYTRKMSDRIAKLSNERIISSSYDKKIKLKLKLNWNADSGECLRTFVGNQ
jgi:hypothetical protein